PAIDDIASGPPGGLRRAAPETAHRIRKVLRHHIVVHGDVLAVEFDLARDAMAHVEVGGGEDVVRRHPRSGDWEAVQREAGGRGHRRAAEATAERVVVVLVTDLRMAVAAVLPLPRAGVAPAGVERVEERDAGRHHAGLTAYARR